MKVRKDGELEVQPVSDNGGSLTIDNSTLSVTGGGTEAAAQRVTIANDSTGVLSVDDNGSSLTVDQSTASNLNAQVVGEVAHDAADSGNPILLGVRAIDYEPDADGLQGPSEVAANDRARIAGNLQGEIIPGVKSARENLTGLELTYDDNPTSATSSAVEVWPYRVATLSFDIDKANTPTTILFNVDMSPDGTNYFKCFNGPLGSWVYDDVAVGSGLDVCLTFPIACHSIKVNVVCAGTDASNTFTINEAWLYLRT